MKRTMNRFLSVLLVCVMTLTLLPSAALAEETPEIVASGYCGGEGDGTNLTWTMDGEGTLTVSGTGPMAKYSGVGAAPWYDLRSDIRTVIVENGVTKVGNYAFSGCTSLQSVTIPVSVTNIDVNTFTDCSALTNVYYAGSRTQWEEMTVKSGNEPLLGAHIHYNAAGHTPGEPTRENYEAPACLTEGGFDMVTRCSVCGEVTESVHHAVPALGHGAMGYNETAVPSTCTVRGYYMKVCLACGEVTDRQIYELDANAHNWGEWEIVKQASEKEEGLAVRVCLNDPSHREEMVIPRYEEDDKGNPTTVIEGIVNFFENTVVSYMRGVIDWFLRLFGRRRP